MHQDVFRFLSKYSSVPFEVDRLIISSFVLINKIEVKKNHLIRGYIIKPSDQEAFYCLSQFVDLLKKTTSNLDFEDLIKLFEFVVSPADKEVNGAVYTPKNIREFILTRSKNNLQIPNLVAVKICDISCGCGGFLIDSAVYLKSETNKSFAEIIAENIYGLDIKDYSINRTKLLLTLLALLHGEDVDGLEFNLFVGNALSFNWFDLPEIEKNKGFDWIVGNPPYVGSSKIDPETKSLLKYWSVSKSGKADLYIPFFQIALSIINEGGVLGYITVNSFFKSLNGRAVRNFFSSQKLKFEVIDFGGEQVFKGRSTYTCICIIQKISCESISYVLSQSANLLNLKDSDFIFISYEQLDDFNGWILRDRKVINEIIAIQSTGKPLGELFQIRNGFATLQNDIYLFKVTKESDKYYFFKKNDIEYKVEKEICKNAIKPNILKSESDIEIYEEKLIFPYIVHAAASIFEELKNTSVKLIKEEVLIEKFPCAYKYLSEHRESLSKRDKGNRTYEAWYAFGRTQALSLYGYKLLCPYISDKPYFVYSADKELLFYNGYAIFSESERELLVLKKILSSTIFWYYIQNASKPYENGYFSLAKNYIKHFGVYLLSEKEKDLILDMSQEEANKFLSKKYSFI